MRSGRFLLRGDILMPEGTVEGSVAVDDGMVSGIHFEEWLDPEDGETLIEGLIAPALLDMHTHLADHGARGDLPVSLEEAFFRDGVKHRFLEGLDDASLRASIKAALDELSPGVDTVLDFREGGVRGIIALNEASSGSATRVLGFGRPIEGETSDDLLDLASGVGMPDLSSCSMELRERARERGLPFALHASELYREEVGKVMELDPDLVIHMVSGTRDDWRQLSDAEIPVVVCPRANQAFGLGIDLKGMLGSGLPMGLGTDNAITVKQDMFREMEQAWSILHRAGLGGTEAARTVLDLATGRAILGTRLSCLIDGLCVWGTDDYLKEGKRASIHVLKRSPFERKTDPWSSVVRFSGQESVLW